MENISQNYSIRGGAFWYFIFFVVLFGGAPIAMKIIFSEMGPFYLGFVRYSIAAIFFWSLVWIKGLEVPRGRALAGAILYGILGFGLSFLFLAWGLVETSASLGSILMALLPLLTIILSSTQGIETLTGRGILGAVIAVLGISLSVGGSASAEISPPHIAAMIIGTAFIGESNVVFKKFPRSGPIITNAVAMGAGAIVLGAISLIYGETWLIPTQSNTWIALFYQVIPVTILAFFLYTQVLTRWTASAVSYAFVLIPLVTVFLAFFFYGEEISVNFILGAVLVLAGVFVGVLIPGKKKEVVDRQLIDCKPC